MENPLSCSRNKTNMESWQSKSNQTLPFSERVCLNSSCLFPASSFVVFNYQHKTGESSISEQMPVHVLQMMVFTVIDK